MQAAIQAELSVDRNVMSVGDTFQLRITVSSEQNIEVSEPRVTNIKGFELLNTDVRPMGSSNKMIEVNGSFSYVMVRNYDFVYTLASQKEGVYQLGPFEVIVSGNKINTNTISVTVQNQQNFQGRRPVQKPSQNQFPGLDEEDPFDPQTIIEDRMRALEKQFEDALKRRGGFGGGFGSPSQQGRDQNQGSPLNHDFEVKNPNELFFIHADVDKKEVFEGEQITVSWYIYTRGNITNLDRLKFPDLKGFWKEIIEEVPALQWQIEVINGVQYQRALLASHALFPIKAGTSVVDEYKIKATVAPLRAFGFSQAYNYTRSSERIEIKVKPLPETNKPSSFSGAVGNFKIFSQVVGANQIPMGQTFQFKVRIEGRGNAKLMELPELKWPEGIMQNQIQSESKFNKDGTSYKEITVSLVATKQGLVKLPVVEISFFDPATANYKTEGTQELEVNILEGQMPTNIPQSNLGSKSETKAATFMPQPYRVIEAGVFLKTTHWLMIVYFVIFSILGFKIHKEFNFQSTSSEFKKKISKCISQARGYADRQDYRNVGSQLLNALYLALSISQDENLQRISIDNILDSASPTLRKELGAIIIKQASELQELSFAPENLIKNRVSKNQLDNNIQSTDDLIKKILKYQIESADLT